MTLKSIFSAYGNRVYISGSDGWHSESFGAFIQPLRCKTKLYLQGEHTPLGINRNDVYLYLGPADHDLTRLDDTYRIHDSNNNIYMLDRSEKINFKNNSVYIWAVIRKTTEGKK